MSFFSILVFGVFDDGAVVVKYFNLLIRVVLVGIIWTCLYGILGRTLIYIVWGFDPAYNRHWIFLWQMWKDGWIIDTVPEWMFLIVIMFYIPVWLLGWLLLAQIKWGQKIWGVLKIIFGFLKKIYDDKFRIKTLVITRRKSYRRIRPKPLPYLVPSSTARAKPKKRNKKRKDGKDEDKAFAKIGELSGQKNRKKDAECGPTDDDLSIGKTENVGGLTRKEILENLKQSFGDGNKIDDDVRRYAEPPSWDARVEKKEPDVMSEEEKEKARAKVFEDARDMIKVRGFSVLEKVDIDGIKVDFVGLSENMLLLCNIDDVEGDWLADEDFVSGEKPSWFCEDKHRISPAFLLSEAREKIKEKLEDDDLQICSILAIGTGNVINAPDMEDVWEEEQIIMCRVGLGAPISLPHFVEVVPEANNPANDDFVKKCKNAFKIA